MLNRRDRARWPAILGLLVMGGVAPGPPEAAAGGTYDDVLAEGRDLFERGEVQEAVKLLRKAERLAEDPSFELLIDLSNAYSRIDAFKDAEEAARRALAVAGGPAEQADAHNRLGIALFAGGNAPPPQLEQAATAFRQALDLSAGRLAIARYNLGEALLKLERDEEGVAELERFVEEHPESPLAARARIFIDEPRRARVPLLPEFEVVTLDGRYLTDQDLIGKVVLLDFWATWCGPCRAALPHLRRLHRRWRDQPFALLSVSVDSREETLRQFVAEEEMEWLQVWDRDRSFSQGLFRVRGYPTYILVDHDGVMKLWSSGWSPSLERELERRVGGALRRARKATRQD